MDLKKRLVILSIAGALGIGAAGFVIMRDRQALEDYEASKKNQPAPVVSRTPPPRRSLAGSVTRALRDMRKEVNAELAQQELLRPGEGADPARAERLLKQLAAARAATIDKYTRAQLKGILQLLRKMLTDEANPGVGHEPEQALLSWRVHFLPLLGHQALYDKFHLDEAWDSPHNMKLLPEMPEAYRHFEQPDDATATAISAISGPGTLAARGRLQRLGDVSDKHSETVALVVLNPGIAEIPWTCPRDIDLGESAGFVRHLSKTRTARIWLGTLEGAAIDIPPGLPYDSFRPLVTIGGSEPDALATMVKAKFKLNKASQLRSP